MRYGFCTGFASSMTGDIHYGLLDDITAAGYDFVEFPLMQTATLSDEAFDQLSRYLADAGLAADCTCNLFPPHLKVTGNELDVPAVTAYLDKAFSRLSHLGTKTIIFGSAGARNLPAGTEAETGYQRLTALLQEYLIPRLEKYDMVLGVEPISKGEANFINTLTDGMELVRRANHPRVQLLADTIHMLNEEETPEELTRFSESLTHIHVSERNRILPHSSYTDALTALLGRLRALGYQGTISFETGPSSRAEITAALQLLRETMEG